MRRIVLITLALVAAGLLAATPAIAGLAGNPSFSHDLPVQVPTQAKSPHLIDDHHRDRPLPTPSASPTQTDDRGGVTTHVEPGDDHGGATMHVEPGDDRGTNSGHGGGSNSGHNG